MAQVENDIGTLYKETVSTAPDIAIIPCIGFFGQFANEHHPFVILKKANEGGGIWEKAIQAEFDTLAEARTFPGAQPYGSSALCSACRKMTQS